ncbi:hypothetical protein [Actinopolyspora mortivallis]|uniref:hypothetical protein n=1 Tax=Actinopolyspora mortivallis TaxID=33906 RepID=UPI00037A419F|nr:hypothetical protein [Actinopolyspora mortivallis]
MKTDNVEYSTFTGWIGPPADILPSLDGDLTYDVAVVGGGMGGMAAAAPRLAERGQDAVLPERPSSAAVGSTPTTHDIDCDYDPSRALPSSSAGVFERTKVADVTRNSDEVVISSPHLSQPDRE